MGKKTAAKLVKFHTENKLLFFSHNEKLYREIGRMVAEAGKNNQGDIFSDYEKMMIDALKYKATPAKHTNVLMHMM